MLRISSLPYQSLSLLRLSQTPPPPPSAPLILCQCAFLPPSLHLSLARPSLLSSPPPCTLQFSFCLPQDVSKPRHPLTPSITVFIFLFKETTTTKKKKTLFPPDPRRSRRALTLTLGCFASRKVYIGRPPSDAVISAA